MQGPKQVQICISKARLPACLPAGSACPQLKDWMLGMFLKMYKSQCLCQPGGLSPGLTGALQWRQVESPDPKRSRHGEEHRHPAAGHDQ